MDTNAGPSTARSSRRISYLLLGTGCVLLAVAFLIGTSDNPPGIVALLAGAFAVILGIFCLLEKPGRGKPAQRLLYWAPRGLCLVIALFLGLFAFDVFGEGQGFWRTALALLMHLVPAIAVLLVLAVSWRREWIGAVLFVAMAGLYAAWSWNKPFSSSAIPLISGPLFLIGALFLLNWIRRRELRGAGQVHGRGPA